MLESPLLMHVLDDLWSANSTMYTPVPDVAHLFLKLTETYLIEEMTSNDLYPDMDSSSSIFQRLEPLDWAFRVQV